MLTSLIIGLTYWFVWPAQICLGLVFFRFKLKPLIPHIAFTTLAMSCFSMFLQSTSFVYLLSAFQFVGLVLSLWLIFRVSLFHSMIMTIFTYSVMLIMEWAMNIAIPSTYIAIVTEHNSLLFLLSGIGFSCATLTVAYLLKRARLGFSFIARPNNRTKQSQLRYQGSAATRIWMLLSFIFIVVDSLFYFFFPHLWVVIATIMLAVLAVLIRVSYQWEMLD